MTEITELLQRLEKQADICSMCGVSVLLRPNDAFVLVEAFRDLQAERNVLRETVEHIALETDNFSGIEAISIYGETILKKLYAPKPCEYVAGRQE